MVKNEIVNGNLSLDLGNVPSAVAEQLKNVKIVNESDYSALECVVSIYDNMSDMTSTFFRSCATVFYVSSNKLYKNLGYKNITLWGEHFFGFKKTNIYDMINVYKKFHKVDKVIEGGKEVDSFTFDIDERYYGFSFSQLIAMSRMNDKQLLACTPDMSVKALTEISKSEVVSDCTENTCEDSEGSNSDNNDNTCYNDEQKFMGSTKAVKLFNDFFGEYTLSKKQINLLTKLLDDYDLRDIRVLVDVMNIIKGGAKND